MSKLNDYRMPDIPNFQDCSIWTLDVVLFVIIVLLMKISGYFDVVLFKLKIKWLLGNWNVYNFVLIAILIYLLDSKFLILTVMPFWSCSSPVWCGWVRWDLMSKFLQKKNLAFKIHSPSPNKWIPRIRASQTMT